MLQRAAKAAGLTIKVHPHMLRHACGYKLANDGRDTRSLQAYLGHKNIQHTVGTPSWRRGGSKISGKTEVASALHEHKGPNHCRRGTIGASPKLKPALNSPMKTMGY